MKAVVCDGFGDESVMRVAEVGLPEPGPGEVRIKVAGAGVNRADLLQRRGLYPPPAGASETIGLEVAGHITAVGREVTRWREGDRVMALLSGGGYAEEAVAAEGSVMPIPDGLADHAAGAVPEVFLTAYLNLFIIGGVRAGDMVVVHGGSGGVGTAAIQLLREAEVTPVVTAGSDERCTRCLELGAQLAVNHRQESLTAAIRRLDPQRRVDLVLDCIGAPYLEEHLRILGTDGRLVVIGLMGGSDVNLDLRMLLSKRLSIIGSTLRSRDDSFKAELVRSFSERFGAALAAGRIVPVIERALPLTEAADAHRALVSGAVFGKLVLTPELDCIRGHG